MRAIKPPTWDFSDLTGARLGLYGRASQDRDGREKSVTDQIGEGERWAKAHGCVITARYSADNNRSASRFATRDREDFARLLIDVQAGKLDGLWFWELTRSQRRLDVFAQLRNLCRDRGVFWVVAGRPYDLGNYADVQALGFLAVMGETETELISERSRRGLDSIAAAGKPHGKLLYGYRRVYDGRGRYVEQVPDNALREATSKDGSTTWYSPAKVVEEIITHVSHGKALRGIARILNDRGIPSPKGMEWEAGTARRIAKNPAYIGKRIHHGEILDHEEPCWPALVSDEVFYAAQNVMNDPARKRTKPTRAVHLVSYIVCCAVCGRGVGHVFDKRDGIARYHCPSGCAAIPVLGCEKFVEKTIIGYLSRRDVHEHLLRISDVGSDAAVSAARAEAERLRGQLETWRAMAESGEADDPITVNRTIKGLRQKIKDEEKKAEQAGIPPVLRGRIGPTAAEEWKRLDMPIKRQIVRTVAEIRILPVGKGRRDEVPTEERIIWRWLLGSPETQPALRPVAKITPQDLDRPKLEQAREIFAEDLAAGRVPGRNRLEQALHVGRPRAVRIQAALMTESN